MGRKRCAGVHVDNHFVGDIEVGDAFEGDDLEQKSKCVVNVLLALLLVLKDLQWGWEERGMVRRGLEWMQGGEKGE